MATCEWCVKTSEQIDSVKYENEKLWGEIIDINKKCVDRGDRIQELESAIREHKNHNEERSERFRCDGTVIHFGVDERLYSVLTEDKE